MEWVPLDSSALTSAAYLEPEHTLYLRFHSGELYRYFNFPPEQYREFLAADSHGRYFANHIRDQFLCEHLARSGRVAGA